jgi:hypothetical protein
MKYCLALAAVILAGATPASALERDIVVELDQECPRGYVSRSLSYGFQHGRLVREGRVCESLHGKN